MITASALSRLINCPGSAVLPRSETASPWADAGHEEHEDLAYQLGAGTLPPEIARFVPAGAKSEVALGFDVSTGVGRVIGENLGRAYGDLAPFEICGAADVVGVTDDAVVVVDFKTGFADVEPARSNPQLAFYALAAARAFGKSRAVVRIVYTKRAWCDEAELDELDLAAFARKLEEIHRRTAAAQARKSGGEVVETREGSWCKHCSSKPYCGSKTALLVQLADRGLAVIGDTTMTPERAASAYHEIVRVEQLVKDARKRLTTFVDEQGPIDIGNGQLFGRYHRKGARTLDGDKAAQAIREIVGEQAKDFESVAIERSTSQAAIERAAKMFAEKRGATKLKLAIINRIDELGGVTYRGDSYPYGEFPAPEGGLPERKALDTAEIDALLERAG